MENRSAVAGVIAVLILVAVAVVVVSIIFVFSQGFFQYQTTVEVWESDSLIYEQLLVLKNDSTLDESATAKIMGCHVELRKISEGFVMVLVDAWSEPFCEQEDKVRIQVQWNEVSTEQEPKQEPEPEPEQEQEYTSETEYNIVDTGINYVQVDSCVKDPNCSVIKNEKEIDIDIVEISPNEYFIFSDDGRKMTISSQPIGDGNYRCVIPFDTRSCYTCDKLWGKERLDCMQTEMLIENQERIIELLESLQ